MSKYSPNIGDVVFTKGNSWLSKTIRFVTRAKVSHVGIMYNKDLIFETHTGANARLNPFTKEYAGKDIVVYRIGLSTKEKKEVKEYCEKYDKSKYSNFDIGTNLLFSWFPPKLRRRTVSLLGSKKMMICSELISRILYNVTGWSEFARFEGMTPKDLKLCMMDEELIFEGTYKE